MKVKNIEIECDLEEIDSENANVAVYVKTEDNFTYGLNFVTPKNLQFFLDKDEEDSCQPVSPSIIVKRITKEIIDEVVHAYAESEDGYWLKVYHFAGTFEESVFDQLTAKEIQREKELAEFTKLDRLLAECQKLGESLKLPEFDKFQESLKELIKFKEDE